MADWRSIIAKRQAEKRQVRTQLVAANRSKRQKREDDLTTLANAKGYYELRRDRLVAIRRQRRDYLTNHEATVCNGD